MWTGKWTNELNALYDAMICEEFVRYIRQSLASKKEMPDIVK